VNDHYATVSRTLSLQPLWNLHIHVKSGLHQILESSATAHRGSMALVIELLSPFDRDRTNRTLLPNVIIFKISKKWIEHRNNGRHDRYSSGHPVFNVDHVVFGPETPLTAEHCIVKRRPRIDLNNNVLGVLWLHPTHSEKLTRTMWQCNRVGPEIWIRATERKKRHTNSWQGLVPKPVPSSVVSRIEFFRPVIWLYIDSLHCVKPCRCHIFIVTMTLTDLPAWK
jgi:hypothetical protein